MRAISNFMISAMAAYRTVGALTSCVDRVQSGATPDRHPLTHTGDRAQSGTLPHRHHLHPATHTPPSHLALPHSASAFFATLSFDRSHFRTLASTFFGARFCTKTDRAQHPKKFRCILTRFCVLRLARDTEVQSGERRCELARRAETKFKLTSNKNCNAWLRVLARHGIGFGCTSSGSCCSYCSRSRLLSNIEIRCSNGRRYGFDPLVEGAPASLCSSSMRSFTTSMLRRVLATRG